MVLFVLVFLRRESLFAGWSLWSNGKHLQIFVGVVTGILAWTYSTYSYNYYLDSFQLLDRIVLIVFFIGVWWKPFFVFPFVLQTIGLASQFMYPLGGYSWAVQDQGLHLLMSFVGYFLLSGILRKEDGRLFIFFSLCLIAIHYFPSGMSKVLKGWVLKDTIEYLIPNAYANGWFPGWKGESINQLTIGFSKFGLLLKLLTLIIECCGIIMLMNRKLARFVLTTLILFHLSVFAVSGIIFWQWLMVELFLLLSIVGHQRLWEKKFGGVRTMVFGIIVLISSTIWLKPVKLTWFDTRANYNYRFYGETSTGKVYQLPPKFFAPYDYRFTVGNFHFLNESPTLPISWGATNSQTAESLKHIRTNEQLLKLEAETGLEFYDQDHVNLLSDFLVRYASNVNKNPDRHRFLKIVAAPRFVQNYSKDPPFDYKEPIEKIRIVQVMSLYGEKGFEETGRRTVFEKCL